MSNYNADSIQQLSFREAVRKRVGMYLGSSDSTGVMASLLELVNNSTDEYLEKKEANRIEITIWPDRASVRDYGRGMPHGPNKQSKEVLITLLTENHSGAKFDRNAYGGKSRGLHGTGASATNLSSDWFEITSYRDNAAWFMRFEKGIPTKDVVDKLPMGDEEEGTFIYYKPSQEVFKSEEIYLDYDKIADEMEEYSYFNVGITFIVINGKTGETREYYSNNGLLDFAKKQVPNPLNKVPFHITATEGDTDIEIVGLWEDNREHEIILFSNGGENPDGGTPVTGIKTSLTNFFKKIPGLNPELATRGLVVICSVNLTDPEYDGQTKVKIKNSHLRGLAQRMTTIALKEFEKTDDYQQIIEFLKRESKAEIAAQEAREAVKKAEKEISKKVLSKRTDTKKLKDARNLGEKATLYIVEGDSGAGSANSGKDPNYHGVLALKGKAINPLKRKLEDVYMNDEVALLMTALGVVPGKYNSKKLRYGKIVILTDPDEDGNHIALLVLNIVQELLPEMLSEGRVYRQIVPTHKREHSGTKKYYYNGEVEPGPGHLSLIKGIGQLNADDMRNTIFSASSQQFKFVWSSEARKVLETIMGPDVDARKEFVFNKIDFSEVAE